MNDIEKLQRDVENCKYILAALWEAQPTTHKYIRSDKEHEIDRIVTGWRARWEEEAMEEVCANDE